MISNSRYGMAEGESNDDSDEKAMTSEGDKTKDRLVKNCPHK